jgi:hypothetical protein
MRAFLGEQAPAKRPLEEVGGRHERNIKKVAKPKLKLPEADDALDEGKIRETGYLSNINLEAALL